MKHFEVTAYERRDGDWSDDNPCQGVIGVYATLAEAMSATSRFASADIVGYCESIFHPITAAWVADNANRQLCEVPF